MVDDAQGLLLVIDRLGRTIAELERQNAVLTDQLNASARQDSVAGPPT